VGSLLFHFPFVVVVVPIVGGEGGVAGSCTGIYMGIPSI
jgi:hypothetical protein